MMELISNRCGAIDAAEPLSETSSRTGRSDHRMRCTRAHVLLSRNDVAVVLFGAGHHGRGQIDRRQARQDFRLDGRQVLAGENAVFGGLRGSAEFAQRRVETEW